MNPIPSADRLFAARLYAVTFYLQHGRRPLLAEVKAKYGMSVVDAARAVDGIDYGRLARRINKKQLRKTGAA